MENPIDKVKRIEDLKRRIMKHSKIDDEEIAHEIALRWLKEGG